MFPCYSVCPWCLFIKQESTTKVVYNVEAPQNISGFVVLYYRGNYYWLNWVCLIGMSSKMYCWGPLGTGLRATALHYSIEIHVLSGFVSDLWVGSHQISMYLSIPVTG